MNIYDMSDRVAFLLLQSSVSRVFLCTKRPMYVCSVQYQE